MTVLVLGGTGFVGKNLKEIRPDWKYLGSADADLKSYPSVLTLFEEEKPTGVINLAGHVGGVVHNTNNNLDMMIDNFLICTNVIKAAMACNVPHLMTALSTCVFPAYDLANQNQHPFLNLK